MSAAQVRLFPSTAQDWVRGRAYCACDDIFAVRVSLSDGDVLSAVTVTAVRVMTLGMREFRIRPEASPSY